MAGDFINVDDSVTTATHAGQLIKYKNLLREARDQGKWLRDLMYRLHDGTDFSALEVLFGLPTGAGNTVFDLVNGSIGAMEGSFQNQDATTLINRVGPGRNL